MILTESRLRQAAQAARDQRVYTALGESLTAYNAAIKYDLFISHSFSDKDLVIGLYHLFNTAGYKVYIDWIDDSSLDRKNVTPSTAQLIKNRIDNSTGTAYISTSNSTSSKWCPWELGMADGMKGRVCILPVMDSDFKGQEYLGLYPYLEYAQVAGKEKYEFWVYDQNDRKKYIVLNSWLHGNQPCYH